MAFAWGFVQSLVQHPAWPKCPESCTWGLATVKVFLGLAALCIRPFCVNRISIQIPALFYLEDKSKESKAEAKRVGKVSCETRGQKLYLEKKEGIEDQNKFLRKLWEETGQIMARILTCSEGP